MGMLRIHCDYCGQAWEVYHRDNWSEPQTRECPHCFQRMDERTWEKVLLAFAEMNDVNMELLQNHEQQHCPLFTVEYVEDYQFRDRHAETLTDIQNTLYDLEELVRKGLGGMTVREMAITAAQLASDETTLAELESGGSVLDGIEFEI